MPKFHYKVELADGTIATRSSFREYTHMIEISPQSIEGYVDDVNKWIAREWVRWESFDKTPEEIARIVELKDSEDVERINDYSWLSASEKAEKIARSCEYNRKYHSVESYADSRATIERNIKASEERRDKTVADGNPTIGNYFASNWCGSLALAEKKVNSRDVRYYTDRGHTVRILPTFLGK